MSIEVDDLLITIETEADDAIDGLDELVGRLEKLKSVTGGFAKVKLPTAELKKALGPLEQMKAEANMAKLNAQMDASRLRSAKAAAGMEKLAQANQKAAQAAEWAAEAQASIQSAVGRAMDRVREENARLQGNVPAPEPVRFGGALRPKAAGIDVSGVQPAAEKLTLLERVQDLSLIHIWDGAAAAYYLRLGQQTEKT